MTPPALPISRTSVSPPPGCVQSTGAVGRASGPATTSAAWPTAASATGSMTAGTTRTRPTAAVSHSSRLMPRPPPPLPLTSLTSITSITSLTPEGGTQPQRCSMLMWRAGPHAALSLHRLMSTHIMKKGSSKISKKLPGLRMCF